jgi:ubiquinone/menaquinone biosynthesis C-methylase UbiE
MVKGETARHAWNRRATSYDTMGDRFERLALGDSREWICSRAEGRTLEVAVGTGRNLPGYRPEVRLVGVDLSPGMLAVARRRATETGRAVEFHEGEAEHLPFPDLSFDTVVCTLAVCAVADRDRAIAEMHRVLRPGGRLLLLDHLERRWLRGRPAQLAVRHGFEVESRQRLRFGLLERLAARRPS